MTTYLEGSLDARTAEWDALCTKQRELEDEGMSEGGKRFRKRLANSLDKDRGTEYGAARQILAKAIDPMEKALEHFVAEQKSKRGIKHVAVKFIEMLGPEVAAYMTVKALFDRLAKGTKVPLYTISDSIVGMMQDELRFRILQKEKPQLFDYKLNSFTTTSYAHMARSLNATVKFSGVDTSAVELTSSRKRLVGLKLIDLLEQSTGIIATQHETETIVRPGRALKHRTTQYVQPSPEVLAFLTKRNAVLEFMAPVNLPMVIPPLQWAPGVRGGYRYALRGKYGIVRAVSETHEARVRAQEMPEVYAALNAIQNTAWRINTRVLDVVNQLVEVGGGRCGLPSSSREDIPERPSDIDTNRDSRRDWRRAAHQVHERNHQRDCKALQVNKVISAAERMKSEAAFFFPHNLDFRGRIYPVSAFLTPQGDDLAKGLLTFAQGKPLGSDGAYWLAIHGANQYGETQHGEKISKLTLEERVQWVEGVSELIEASAAGASDFWMHAEDPFQFLAFCFEWAQYIDWRDNGIGNEYVCSLPVSQDGSCNGLQHFSAMLRDERGGRAVNLIPSDRPQDVYDDIRKLSEDYLEARAADDPYAAMWLKSGLLTRKLAKRPTMTFSYGSKPYGFQQQIAEFLLGLDNWPELKPLFTEVSERGQEELRLAKPCQLMSQAIWHSLREAVVAAFEGMEWLQQCAREVVKTGKPVEWVVPITGFFVQQEYYEQKRREVRTILAGKIIKSGVYDVTDRVYAVKQANAVAPNVVHSLDAAALMLTMAQCAVEGVEHFAAVHDSYGTLPADMGVLARATRQSFVRLYQEVDVVEMLREQFVAQAGQELPPAPPKGTLDLSQVLASPFFFS